MENQKINPDDLKGLLDDVSSADISQLPPPKGVSKEFAEMMRKPEINSEMYSYNELANKIKNMPVEPKVSTCRPEIDQIFDGGFQNGELIILSGPTKNGKTVYSQNMSFLQASNNIPVIWFSYEMSWQELTRKFMEMDWENVMMDCPAKVPLYYPIDNRNSSMDWFRKKIYEAKEKFGAKMVYIDHLHYLIPLTEKGNNLSFSIGKIIRELNGIAVEMEIPILLIAHTKKIEVDKMPDINSLKDSSSIAQESDAVLILWRERKKSGSAESVTDYYDDVMDDEIYTGRTIVSIEANRRTGRTRKISMGMINGQFYVWSEYLALKNCQDSKDTKDEDLIKIKKEIDINKQKTFKF